MAFPKPVEKEKVKVKRGKKGRPKKEAVANTGGGLPFFNPYGGGKKK